MQFLFTPLLSQNFNIKTFTTETGLPHNNVKSIVQDKTGFLWIATWDGLSRFDGYEFKNYFHKPDDSTSLPFFLIIKLCLDNSNNLWVLDNSGKLSLYNRLKDNFIRLDSRDSLFLDNPISDIALDTSEKLLIITEKGNLYKYNYELEKFNKIGIFDENEKEFNIEDLVPSISLDNNGNFWIRTREIVDSSNIYKCSISVGELGKPDLLTVKNKYLSILDKSHYNLPYNFIPSFSFYEPSKGKIWMLSNIGIFSLDSLKDTFMEFKNNIPVNEFVSGNKLLWSKFKDSIFFINPSTKILIRLRSESFDHIEATFLDKFNTLWFGSMTDTGEGLGLTRCTIISYFFKNYLLTPDKPNEHVAVFSVLKDNHNNIWVGARNLNYLLRIKPSGEKIKVNSSQNSFWKDNNHPRSMVEDSDGIWMGFYNMFLVHYNYNKNKFTERFSGTDLIKDSGIQGSFREIILEKDHNILTGSNSLFNVNTKNRSAKLLWSSGTKNIYSITKDLKNGYWIGNNNLIHLDSIFREVKIVEIAKSRYSIHDICHGSKDELWMTLQGGGICRYNVRTGKKDYYTTGNGLSNNTTYKILKDSKGNLWISTNRGISMFDPHTNRFRTFGPDDGLRINEFNHGAGYCSSDGEMFFGGMGGFVSFYPDSLKITDQSRSDNKLFLIDLKVSGETRHLSKPLNESDTVILMKGENNFALSFSCTDFINSEIIRYRYKMSDVNKNSIETDFHNRNINYSNLKPGWYNLSIEATDKNGNWNTSKALTLRMRPYFYQTKFFIITIPILVLTLITAIINIYVRQLKQKEKQKQDSLRLQSLRGQMNPHFIFNSLNSINYFISNNDKLSANRYIADFARLIRSILTNMGSDYVPFNDELNSIRDYLNIEHLRFGDKFDFELTTHEVSDAAAIEIFPGLVQPFVENAIWHGIRALEKRKGKICIRFLSDGNDKINCIIEDDGIGRKVSMEKNLNRNNHKSKGISIVMERLDIISKLRRISYKLKIYDLYNDRAETGTRVEIDLPCKYAKTQKL